MYDLNPYGTQLVKLASSPVFALPRKEILAIANLSGRVYQKCEYILVPATGCITPEKGKWFIYCYVVVINQPKSRVPNRQKHYLRIWSINS
ncbi:MAG: hypothetical protein HW386_2583 [Gammaproteobacteria bacterium]|nr:hypothetical protein [Gammaproteobacteria bacterium]